ncbi:multinuclear nonheme iron-dependent oxidase [Streptomyces sp. HD]|uniref:multinuclear nonheme iron-dependent oxidase n=1 Tax=Streptomyces sp. HD TaxID=3020892 RepID=UPI00232AB363|nr:DUF692 family multinuclear iron-containing protein [Streptomyces sp. HD]MDC0768628.1 DUF692 family protein [Streptomyces sp. HD]
MERLGTGIGWRPEIADAVERMPGIDWVETVAENVCPGHLPESLLRLRERGVTVVPHGVSLGLGGAERPDADRLAALAERVQALGSPLVTEHIAFVRAGGALTASPRLEAGHLLPVPRTRDALDVLCENVRIAQDALPVPLAVENIAALISWPGEEMTEGQFLYELADRTGVRLLIDVANLHTNHVNRDEDPAKALAELPLEAIAYVHVAGGFERDGVWHDSHAHPVPQPVLDILTDLASRVSPPGVLLERDENFPEPGELERELTAIRGALEKGAAEREASWERAFAHTDTASTPGPGGTATATEAGASREAAGDLRESVAVLREAAGEQGAADEPETAGEPEAAGEQAAAGEPETTPEQATTEEPEAAPQTQAAGEQAAASEPETTPEQATTEEPEAAPQTQAAGEQATAGEPETTPEQATTEEPEAAPQTQAAGEQAAAEEPDAAGEAVAAGEPAAAHGQGSASVAVAVELARQRLALAQAALLSALVAGTPVPEGFDRVRLGVQARALAGKRADVVAKVAPELPVILGQGYRRAFVAYTHGHPMSDGYRRDALDFAGYLLSEGRLEDARMRAELREWWLERLGPKPRSRRPGVRLARATRRVLLRR